MAAIKKEFDAHELQPVSSFVEYQLNNGDPIPMTPLRIKGEGKLNMGGIKTEPDSDEDVPFAFCTVDLLKTEESMLGSESTLEEPCVVATIKEEVMGEIQTGEHKVCSDRSYNTEEVSLAVATGKEEVKDEISTEDNGVPLDSIEAYFIKEEHGTSSSTVDIAECLENELDSPEGTDPLLHSETNSGSYCVLPQYSDNEENRGRKCELKNMKMLGHRGDKSFSCEICKKCFKHRRNLVAHIPLHTGETSFKCDLCNKSFSRRVHLKTHSLIHTGEKPFECEVCQKVFRQYSNLWAHSRIHNGVKPFKCDVCNKSFSRRVHLKTHSLIHTGEKPFECDVCHKVFRQFGNLWAHSRIHTGVKPFKCEFCNICYSDRRSLESHSRLHTDEHLCK